MPSSTTKTRRPMKKGAPHTNALLLLQVARIRIISDDEVALCDCARHLLMTDTQDPAASTLDLALESWRFQRLFTRAIQKLDEAEAARFLTQHRYFLRRVGECLATVGLRFETTEGQRFDPGDAMVAVNVSDFGPDDELVVDQVIEPVVMGASGLVRSGPVTVRRAI